MVEWAFKLQNTHLWKTFWREWKCKKKLCDAKQFKKKMAVSCYQLQYYAVAGFLLQSVRSFGFVSFQTAERTTVEKIWKLQSWTSVLDIPFQLHIVWRATWQLCDPVIRCLLFSALCNGLRWLEVLLMLLPWLVGPPVGSLQWCHKSWVCNNLSAVWADIADIARCLLLVD